MDQIFKCTLPVTLKILKKFSVAKLFLCSQNLVWKILDVLKIDKLGNFFTNQFLNNDCVLIILFLFSN